MKITKIDQYKDGGTYELVTTDFGVICIDNRLGSRTKGRLYNGYPKYDKTNLIVGFDSFYNDIIESLKQTDDQSLKIYEEGIVKLINSRNES